jgi:hypothetical protein
MEATRSSETSEHPTRRNNPEEFLCHPVAQGVCRLRLTMETRVLSQACLCGICGGQGHTLRGFSLKPSVFPGLFTRSFIRHRRYVRLATDNIAKYRADRISQRMCHDMLYSSG